MNFSLNFSKIHSILPNCFPKTIEKALKIKAQHRKKSFKAKRRIDEREVNLRWFQSLPDMVLLLKLARLKY